jgi:hypothetical protein
MLPALNVPAGHGRGAVAPIAQNEPAGHAMHAARPMNGWYEPAGHGAHSLTRCPAAANVPGAQRVHTDAPAREKDPSAHALHEA